MFREKNFMYLLHYIFQIGLDYTQDGTREIQFFFIFEISYGYGMLKMAHTCILRTSSRVSSILCGWPQVGQVKICFIY